MSRGLPACVSQRNRCAPEQDASSAVGRQRRRDGLDGVGGGLRPRSVGGADGPGVHALHDGEQGPGQAPQRQRRRADGAAIPVLPGSLLCPSRVDPVWCFTVTG